MNQLFDLGILGPRQVHADRLRDRKREIHADPSIRELSAHAGTVPPCRTSEFPHERLQFGQIRRRDSK
jgi:hypothetical protein